MRKVYIHNKCVSPLKIVRCTSTRILDTALFIKFVSDLRKVGGCSPCTPVCPYNKTERHDITEILLEVARNTKTLALTLYSLYIYHIMPTVGT